MASREVQLNPAGVKAVLLSNEVAKAVDGLAEQVADNVRSQGLTVADGGELPVEVSPYTTDRRAAAVTITHAAGIGMQAKHGALTKAAAQAGLEVKGES